MAVDIEELIIAPLREVVDRGKEAVANAEAADDREDDADDTATRMAKAGKALVREGERALKRLQPLWDDQVKKYGDAFKTAMDKNEEIEERRRKLDGLVYDFEDYIEIDTFDEDKFTELQAAVKSLALHVLDIIKKLNLDGVLVNPPPATVSVFPPLPPLPPLPPSVLRQGAAKSPSRSPTLNHMSKPPSRGRDALPQGTEHPSRPQQESGTLGSVTTSSTDGRRRRPTPQGVLRRDTTTSHASSHYSVDTLPPYSSEDARPVGAQQAHAVDRTPAAQMHRSTPPLRSTPDGPGSQRSHMRAENEPFRPAAAEPLEIPVFPISRTTKWVTEQAAVPASPRLSRPLTIRESIIPEGRAVTSNSPRSSTATPGLNHINHPLSPLSPVQSPDGLMPSPSLGPGSPPMPPLSLPSAAAEIESGLMVSEDWKTVVSDGANSGSRALLSVSSREPECSIGPKSSLYQMNGFCKGAQAFKQGGHLQAVKKVQGYVAGVTTYTGKCISCGYAHQYDELDMDVTGDPKANFTSSNIRFRVRFLYKSHLATTRSPEAYYGCLFCAHAGSVVREGDATVFATSDALFRHLARHPQPLPAVPDVTVLYGGSSDTQDFDVHFLEPSPAEPAETDSNNNTTQHLPTATATKMHLQRYGEKKLPRPEGLSDKRELLQFFAGATVVGVEFPAAWAGKWATGWHDGRWGFFPAKCVELERPRRRSEMPPLLLSQQQQQQMASSSSSSSGGGMAGGLAVTRSVVARWKWEPGKDAAEKGWLVFDKGETITHVGWVERERWCWSGVNKKGQVGVFPRSHVRWDQVKEEVASSSPIARPVTSRGLTKRGFFGRSKSVAAATSSSASSISGASSVIEIVI